MFKKNNAGPSKARWLIPYKIFVFATGILLVWLVSPLVAKDTFETDFLGILFRIWFTLLWAGGLASLFDMKTGLARAQGNIYRERPKYFAYLMGFSGCIVWAVAGLVIRETIQAWFQLERELATPISVIWSILVSTAMTKAGLDLSRERQNEVANP